MAIAVLATACGSGGANRNGPTAAAEPGSASVAVRIGLNPSVAGLAEYVAQDQGMFAANGLDVTITPTTDLSVLPAAVGNQFDFVMSVQPILFAAAAHGLPVVATAGGQVGTQDSPNAQLIVAKGSAITGAPALAGATVGVPTVNGNFAACTLQWVKSHGVAPESVHLTQVAFPNIADTLQAGRIDAGVSIAPFATKALVSGDYVSLGDPCLAISPESTGAFLISNQNWAREHLDAIGKVQKSIAQANTWIHANQIPAKAILAKYTGAPVDSLADVTLPTYIAAEPVADLQAWIDALDGLGMLPAGVPAAKDLVVGP